MVKKRSASLAEEPAAELLGSNPTKELKMDSPRHVESVEKDDDEVSMGEFEDPFEDEMEEEEIIYASENDDADQEMAVDEVTEVMEQKAKEDQMNVYLPGQALQEGEVLDYDPRAYRMYHSLSSEWPCLSFDVLPDQLGNDRNQYPMSMYLVAGTQADTPSANKIFVMKASRLCRTYKGSGMESDEESDDEGDDIDEDPVLEYKTIKHHGGINRVRVMARSGVQIAATWAETGQVHIWDLADTVKSLDQPGFRADVRAPLHSVTRHKTEGFAMDWSSRVGGSLLSGDCRGEIYLTRYDGSAGWTTEPQAFGSHTASVEDLQWSPTQDTVFASSSVDQTIRLWDTRMGCNSQLSIKAHDSDVNVISWSHKLAYLVASGADDGSFRIWDLRMARSGKPSASYEWHKAPITSIEWSPSDESVLAVAGADHQISVWDFSVEADEETLQESQQLDIPPQLMFIHQGQSDIKELHWHRQIPGVVLSTSATGFDIFKPISMD